MAKSFTENNHNGPDPHISGGQFDENKSWYRDLQNDNSVTGDGNESGRQFQDSDDVYGLEGFNIIDSADDDYAGKSSSTTWKRTSVSVDKSDRGPEF